MTGRKLFVSFTHIEKAGGITLHNILHHNFSGYVSPSPHESGGRPIHAADVRRWQRFYPLRIQGVGGHRILADEQFEDVCQCPVFRFTFLREPHSRYLSYLNWHIHHTFQKWTLESFAANAEFNDYQTFRIAGERDASKAIEIIERRSVLTGLMECYDKSLLLLRRELGLERFDVRYEHSNVSPREKVTYLWQDLTVAEKELVRRANVEDCKLYEYVQNVAFPRLTTKYQDSLETDVQSLRTASVGFRFSAATIAKRKISNLYVKKILQRL